jgi:FkbM family methyltransferase
MTDIWEERAQQGAERKRRLMSFGPYAHGILVKAKSGGFYVVDAEDSSVSAILLNEGSFYEAERALAESLISASSDVLVVGPHIGGHAVPLSKSCNELIAIEANPNTFAFLKANLLLNECSNVTCYNIGASDKAEKIQFILNRENSGGSKRMPPVGGQRPYFYDDPEVIEIDCISLDTLLGHRQFDLIFMDIEGSEYFALKGMQQILARSRALSVEFLPHHISGVANVSVEEFIAQIEPHFQWMYIPGYDFITPKHEITNKVKEMYYANQGHDGIYFLKEISDDWLKQRNIVRPA